MFSSRRKSIRHSTRRRGFRPKLERLEERLTPTLNLVAALGSLTISGTPDAMPGESLTVQSMGSDTYRVMDGADDLGTYTVTDDIRLELESIDSDVLIDLASDTLTGSIFVDLGEGDRDPLTPLGVSVFGSPFIDLPNGVVEEDIHFSGGSGGDFLWVYGMDVGGDISASSVPITSGFLEDRLLLFFVNVAGNVMTSRITYLTLDFATVDGNVSVNTVDSPCGMSVSVRSTAVIHGNLDVTGGGTNPSCVSLVSLLGTIHGNVDLDLIGTHPFRTVGIGGTIGGDLRVTAGDAVTSNVIMIGTIGGNANLDLGGSTTTSSRVQHRGSIGGNLNIRGNSGVFQIDIGARLANGTTFGGKVGGNLIVHLGDGTNTLNFNGSFGSKIGGILNYHGGRGADTINITGVNDFRIVVHTGGGKDKVAFSPEARVDSALINFGPKPGDKQFVAPNVVDFALKLLHYK